MRNVIALILLVAVIVSAATYLLVKSNSWKVYKNDDYHFEISIPQSWNSKQGIGENGSPTFNLSSGNNKIVVQNFLPENTIVNQGDGRFNPDLQIGTYKTLSSVYVSTNSEKMFRLDLYRNFVPKHQDLFLYVTVDGNYENNKQLLQKILSSFSYTQDDPSIESLISYSLPRGWKKEEGDDTQALAFVSSDAIRNDGSPYLTRGAGVTVSYSKGIHKNASGKLIPIEDLNWNDFYSCSSEGCSEVYSITHANYTLSVGMHCVGLAACYSMSKSTFNTTQYAKDRDAFLKSIKFK